MKINESSVEMSGKRHYSQFQETRAETVIMSATKWNELQNLATDIPAEISISKESQSLLEQLKEQKGKDSKQQNEAMMIDMLQKSQDICSKAPVIQTEEDHMIKTLRRILEMLKAIRNGENISYTSRIRSMKVEDIMEEDKHFGMSGKRGGKTFSLSQNVSVIDLRSASANTLSESVLVRSDVTSSFGGATTWIRHTEKNSFRMEQETVSFSATGIAKTTDGREINFGVDLEMSRGFAGYLFESSTEEVVLTDPLVINLEEGSASVSDQKFFFDIDVDGNKEELSFLGKGSGFLAFDRNADGIINDGSELFGTKSGDGFLDLAKYDEDANGWIDENDRIFKELKVWTKDLEGQDKLIDLQSADVGAIYLANVNTQFHLNNSDNKTNGIIQKTGVFLRESGSVGTIQHVDLAL